MKANYLLGVASAIALFSCSNTNIISSGDHSFSIANQNEIAIYFSRTNNTERIANFISEIKGIQKYEITAKTPYSDSDINYNDPDSRANKEQNDPNARPAIGSEYLDIDPYDVIYLGYPIWWGQAPKIMYTFLEQYEDLSGKTIVPFCTSASSSVGTSATNLSSSAPNATWLEGTRFNASTSKEEVEKWIKHLSIETKEQEMKLEIDDQQVDITWLDNDSVKALAALAPLDISMHRYGGFEQVGPIGQTLVSNDEEITTSPGDVILYDSNQIVVFFGTNSWRYTRLGHINLDSTALNELLNKESVTLHIK